MFIRKFAIAAITLAIFNCGKSDDKKRSATNPVIDFDVTGLNLNRINGKPLITVSHVARHNKKANVIDIILSSSRAVDGKVPCADFDTLKIGRHIAITVPAQVGAYNEKTKQTAVTFYKEQEPADHGWPLKAGSYNLSVTTITKKNITLTIDASIDDDNQFADTIEAKFCVGANPGSSQKKPVTSLDDKYKDDVHALHTRLSPDTAMQARFDANVPTVADAIKQLHTGSDTQQKALAAAAAVFPLFADRPERGTDSLAYLDPIITSARHLALKTEGELNKVAYIKTYYYAEAVKASALLLLELDARTISADEWAAYTQVAPAFPNAQAMVNTLHKHSRGAAIFKRGVLDKSEEETFVQIKHRKEFIRLLKRMTLDVISDLPESEGTSPPQEIPYDQEFAKLYFQENSLNIIR